MLYLFYLDPITANKDPASILPFTVSRIIIRYYQYLYQEITCIIKNAMVYCELWILIGWHAIVYVLIYNWPLQICKVCASMIENDFEIFILVKQLFHSCLYEIE